MFDNFVQEITFSQNQYNLRLQKISLKVTTQLFSQYKYSSNFKKQNLSENLYVILQHT